jgi:hypothetical protein
LDFEETDARLQGASDWVSEERQAFHTAISDLLGTHYPLQ